VRQTVSLDRVEAFEIEHRFDEAIGGGIAIDRGNNVRAERGADCGITLECIGVSLPDQFGRYIGAVEALGHAVDDRGFQRVVMQDGRIDEGRELGFAPRDLLGLAADARPDRVDRVEPAARLRLMLGHRRLPQFSIPSGRNSSTARCRLPLYGKSHSSAEGVSCAAPPVMAARQGTQARPV
jgi:hypothetical protein